VHFVFEWRSNRLTGKGTLLLWLSRFFALSRLPMRRQSSNLAIGAQGAVGISCVSGVQIGHRQGHFAPLAQLVFRLLSPSNVRPELKLGNWSTGGCVHLQFEWRSNRSPGKGNLPL
jgi:hypothetical protein